MTVSHRPKKTRHSPSSVAGLKERVRELEQELKEERLRRIAAEKRAERLERRVEELEQENKRLRDARYQTEEFLHNKIRELELTVSELTHKLDAALKTIAWFQEQKFGSQKETVEQEKEGEETKEVEAEKNADSEKAEDKSEDKANRKPKGQKPGSKGHGRTANEDVPMLDEINRTLEGLCCDRCRVPYLKLPKTDDSTVFEILTVIYKVLYHRARYVPQCNCNGKKVVTAPAPPTLYPRTNIGNSLWVHLFIHRFLHGTPTSRILRDLTLQGFNLAAGTVTGGLKLIEKHFCQLYEDIVNHCRGADLHNADETTWRVFDADKVRWWFWVFASKDAVVYILDQSRSQKIPADFLAGSTTILVTDRYSAYKALKEAVRKAYCWVHQRRDFRKIFQGIKKLKRWAKEWLTEIGWLFAVNHKRVKLWKEKKNWGKQWDEVEQAVRNKVDEIKKRLDLELSQSELHPQQKKVLNSLKNHWNGLTIFLEDPRIPMDNNRAERLLRPLAIMRKTSYGSQAEWSGHLSAKVFSILQTWLMNGLDPQALLLDFFDACAEARVSGKPPPETRHFLPWTMSEERKQSFSMHKSIKRPA